MATRHSAAQDSVVGCLPIMVVNNMKIHGSKEILLRNGGTIYKRKISGCPCGDTNTIGKCERIAPYNDNNTVPSWHLNENGNFRQLIEGTLCTNMFLVPIEYKNGRCAGKIFHLSEYPAPTMNVFWIRACCLHFCLTCTNKLFADYPTS